MKAVVGLGNPGPEYAETRHNLGFRVAEAFCARHGVVRFRARGAALEARVRVGGAEVLVAKPQDYMNRSGPVVRALLAREGAGVEDLVVTHDDLDLEFGAVRIKRGGGAGGHNGLRSLLEELGSGDFVRVRLGIRRPVPDLDAAEWVLQPFDPSEREGAERLVERGADAVEAVLAVGPARAMNEFNRRPRRVAPEAAPS